MTEKIISRRIFALIAALLLIVVSVFVLLPGTTAFAETEIETSLLSVSRSKLADYNSWSDGLSFSSFAYSDDESGISFSVSYTPSMTYNTFLYCYYSSGVSAMTFSFTLPQNIVVTSLQLNYTSTYYPSSVSADFGFASVNRYVSWFGSLFSDDSLVLSFSSDSSESVLNSIYIEYRILPFDFSGPGSSSSSSLIPGVLPAGLYTFNGIWDYSVFPRYSYIETGSNVLFYSSSYNTNYVRSEYALPVLEFAGNDEEGVSILLYEYVQGFKQISPCIDGVWSSSFSQYFRIVNDITLSRDSDYSLWTFIMNNFTVSGLSLSFDDGFDSGYSQGSFDGFNRGVESANNTVNKSSASYAAGYYAGSADSSSYSFYSLIGAVIDVPIKAFTSLFNFDILGVNMLNFVSSLFTILVLIAVGKIVLGFFL